MVGDSQRFGGFWLLGLWLLLGCDNYRQNTKLVFESFYSEHCIVVIENYDNSSHHDYDYTH